MSNKYARPVWAEVNLSHIKYNLEQIKKRIIAPVEIMAVVKADAYGHGLDVVKTLVEAGVDRLAVALVEEAVALRQAGIKNSIQLLNELLVEEYPLVFKYDLIPTISKEETAIALNQLAKKQGIKKKVHIMVDTGMGRLGVLYEQGLDFVKKIFELEYLQLEGLMTHFARADEKDKAFTHLQNQRFANLLKKIEELGIEIPIKHVANSATIIDLPQYQYDMIRPGIMLYGLAPSAEVEAKFKLKAALTWKAKIIYLKEVAKGTTISYGSSYITPKKAIIATIPVGYADGYSRLLSNKGEVLIKGKRAPVRGRVCMDLIMVEVTDIPGVKIGEEVVLLGKQKKEEIKASYLADLIGTINYELVCNIGKRVPRIYKK